MHGDSTADYADPCRDLGHTVDDKHPAITHNEAYTIIPIVLGP